MEQLEKQDKTVRKLKKQLKVFAKKIGELEGTFVLSDKDLVSFVIWLSSYPSVLAVVRSSVALASVYYRNRTYAQTCVCSFMNL